MSQIRDLALDASGDLKVSGGDLSFVDDTAAIIQSVSNRLQFWQGEWFLDTRQGMPYAGSIFVRNANLALIKSIYRRAIESSPGISSVTRVDVVLDGSTRKLTVTWEAKAVTGVKIVQKDNLIFPVGSPTATVTA